MKPDLQYNSIRKPVNVATQRYLMAQKAANMTPTERTKIREKQRVSYRASSWIKEGDKAPFLTGSAYAKLRVMAAHKTGMKCDLLAIDTTELGWLREAINDLGSTRLGARLADDAVLCYVDGTWATEE